MKTKGGLWRQTSYLTEEQRDFVKAKAGENSISESAFIAALVQRAMVEPPISSGEIQIALEAAELSPETIDGILSNLYEDASSI